MTRVVAAVLGTGRIGRVHAENISFHLPEVFLKAVADPQLDEAWAQRLGVPVRGRDAREVLADPEIDAVVIATSSAAHATLIEAAADAGKQIFCEKPVAFEPARVEAAAKAARQAGVKLQVGFNRRFDPSFRRVRETVREGRVGEPYILHVVDRDPRPPAREFLATSGGLFRDLAIHDFDLVRFLTGQEVVEVYTAAGALADPQIAANGDVDTALTTLRLSHGTLALIDNSRQAVHAYDQRIEVLGSLGSIAAGNIGATATVLSTAEGVFADPPFQVFSERFKEAYIAQLREFFACVRNGSEPSVGAEDTLAALRVAEAAETSHRENRPIEL